MAQRLTDPDLETDDRSWTDACVDRYVAGGPQGSPEDVALRIAVSARLVQDRLMDARDIVVQVEQGLVTLEGRVRTSADRRLADLLTHEVTGVSLVYNHLAVQPDLFGEPPAFRPFNRAGGGSLGEADRAEAERNPTAPSLPPFIT